MLPDPSGTSPPRPTPLDHPYPERPKRLYFAVTNHCNRACPWCSTCSSPRGSTFLPLATFRALLPAGHDFEAQLEGGEPTTHPAFWDLVAAAREHPRCRRLVVCTNGVLLPRHRARLAAWLGRCGRPLSVKLSVNHYLLEHDPGLLDLAGMLRDAAATERDGLQLVVNVRLRRGEASDDRAVAQAVAAAGLGGHANEFFLQAYGFAAGHPGWDTPRPVWDNFLLLNPDGAALGTDLLARSEAMRRLP
jgi:hypothetical protein